MNKKGFTLIELLIVIGILAVLSTATILMLNPAQMFAEARDMQRMNDLNTLSTAISLMQATSTAPSLYPTDWACATEYGSTISGSTAWFTTAGFVEATTPSHNGFTTLLRAIDSSGWVGANLSLISGGSPMAVLPIDPSNKIGDSTSGGTASGYNYQYACDGVGKYELDANLESTKYASGGTSDKESTDGGPASSAAVYETGSILTL